MPVGGRINSPHVATSVADESVDSAAYVDGSIDTAHIADLQITTGLIAADAVTSAKIADDAIDSEHYTDNSVDAAHLFDLARGSVLIGNASAATAELTIGSNTYVLKSDGTDIAWAADAGGTPDNDSVTGAKIADDAVDSEHYVDGSIDNAHIADDAIDSEHYADGSIDEAHIADNQVTLAKMAGLARGKVIYGDASGDPAALAAGSANTLLGSDGTDVAYVNVTSAMITNGTIIDADLNASAAIAISKTALVAGTNITLSTNTLAVDDAFLKNDANDTTTGVITAGGLTLSEAASVSIGTPLLPTTDHTYSGMSAEMLAGGTIGAQDLVCIHTTTQEVVVADASAVATARAIGIAPAAISNAATGTVLLQGFIRDTSWSWTTGGVLYLSETAGVLTHTAPTTDGAFVQVVGIALSPVVAYINPSLDIIEHA